MRVFHLLSTQHALLALKHQRLKVALFDELNDPFELLPADPGNPRDRLTFTKFKTNTSNEMGLLCFSRRWRNPLLWSHYADRHRGVALEFKIDDDLFNEVRYRSTRLRFNVQYIVSHGGFTEEHAIRIATTKSKHWAYEEEVRVPVHLTECAVENGIYFEKLTDKVKVVGIVLGSLSRLTTQEIRLVLPKGQQLKVRRARLAFHSFNIVRNRAIQEEVIYGAA